MKRLKRLILVLLPLLTAGCIPGLGQVLGVEELLEDQAKKLIDALTPTWRGDWFVTGELPYLDQITSVFVIVALTIATVVALVLLYLSLQGAGMALPIQGVFMLVVTGGIAFGIGLMSFFGIANMPPEMTVGTIANKLRWIYIDADLMKDWTIATAVKYTMNIPQFNQSMQILVNFWFSIGMWGALSAASPKKAFESASWLFGPPLYPLIFWGIVENIGASYTASGVGMIDNNRVIWMNTRYLFVTGAAMFVYVLPWLIVKSTGWFFGSVLHMLPASYNSLNAPKETQQGGKIGFGELVAFGAGTVAGSGDGEDEDGMKKSKSKRNKKRRGGSGSSSESGASDGDYEPEDEYPYGPDGPRALLDDPDAVIDVEATDPDDDGGPGDGGEGPTGEDGNPTGSPDDGGGLSPLTPNDGISAVDPSLDNNPSFGSQVYGDQGSDNDPGSDVGSQSVLGPNDGLTAVPDDDNWFRYTDQSGREVLSHKGQHSQEMIRLIQQHHGFDNIPFASMSNRVEHADDVMGNIEESVWQSTANYMRYHPEDWKQRFNTMKQSPNHVVTVKGGHYRIVSETDAPMIGAVKRRINFKDGRNPGTYFLEYVGEVPRSWKKRFPNTGEFLSSKGDQE